MVYTDTYTIIYDYVNKDYYDFKKSQVHTAIITFCMKYFDQTCKIQSSIIVCCLRVFYSFSLDQYCKTQG